MPLSCRAATVPLLCPFHGRAPALQVCVEATQQELEHLWQVCRHELAAATRITSSAMRLMLQRGSHLVPANAVTQLEQLGKQTQQ